MADPVKKNPDTVEQPLSFEEAAPAPPDAVKDDGEAPLPAVPLVPEARAGGAPSWVKLPEGLVFPRGRAVLFLRFPAAWTDTPQKGHEMPDEEAVQVAGAGALWRQCIVIPLTVEDKKHALLRASGDTNRVGDELSKQMIRSVDGYRCDWSGMPSPGSIDIWWNEVGERVRNLLSRVWMQLHTLKREEQQSFFEHCIAVRLPG